MPLNMKVVCLDKLHNFPIRRFEVFRKNLENVAKVLADMDGSTRSQGFFSRVLTKVDYG
jgi:hypothetical protein